MAEPLQMPPDLIVRDLAALLMCYGPALDVDWRELLVAAGEQGVEGLLYIALRALQAKSISPELLAALENTYRRTQVRNITLREELRSVLERLAAAGIPAIVLKGAALVELVYGDIGLRPMCDVDLLVRLEHAKLAETLMHEAGYSRAGKPEVTPGFDRMFRINTPLQSPAPFGNMVEIHWRLSAPLFISRSVDYTAVWERAAPVTLAGQPAYALGAEDWVLHLAVHTFYSHRQIRLLNLVDLDRLVRYFDERLDWDKMLEIGESFHWLPALAAVLPQALYLFGTPIPDDVIRTAEAYKLPEFDRRLFAWWLTPGRSDRQHVFPDWLILAGLGPRLRVLWAYLFPDRAYMETRYPEHSVWKLPFQYLHRLWRGTDFE